MALPIDIADFSFRYLANSPYALDHISLKVPAGTICAILGPTNAGKTTLLHAIAGVAGNHNREAIASGTMHIGDNSYVPLPKHVLFPTVGLTIQEPYFQISGLRETVLDEIILTLECLGVSSPDARDRARYLVDSLGLAKLAERKPSTLSGGELQRVALATILIAESPVLLLDEPCNSLDGMSQHRLATLLCTLKHKTTILLGDYQVEFALKIADQFVVLSEGKIVFSGNRFDFLEGMAELQRLLPLDLWIGAINKLKQATGMERITRLVGLR